jgi:hypothetical protein
MSGAIRYGTGTGTFSFLDCLLGWDNTCEGSLSEYNPTKTVCNCLPKLKLRWSSLQTRIIENKILDLPKPLLVVFSSPSFAFRPLFRGFVLQSDKKDHIHTVLLIIEKEIQKTLSHLGGYRKKEICNLRRRKI